MAKLDEIEALLLTSHKVKSTIQKLRIGFGEIDPEGADSKSAFKSRAIVEKSKNSYRVF